MKNKTKLLAQNTLNLIKNKKYHYSHKMAALKILEMIEKEKGKLPISIKEQCDSYAKDKLGHIKYAPWLYVYSSMHGEFREGWIPDNYYGEVIVGEIDKQFFRQGEMKPLANRVLQTRKLPDLLYTNNGLFIEPENYEVVSSEEASSLLFKDNDQVIFKSNDSERGRGVFFCTKSSWSIDEALKTNGVFQKVIKQHPFFDSIFPFPGATIRMTTALNDDGTPMLRSAYLRLGRSNEQSSSTHVKDDLVKIAIDMNSGSLSEIGYLADWSSIKFHPDTHVKFKGLKIPEFNKARSGVEDLHKNFPFVQCIGWDISINENGELEVMEWNSSHNDIKFSEAIHGPCFQDMLERSFYLR